MTRHMFVVVAAFLMVLGANRSVPAQAPAAPVPPNLSRDFSVPKLGDKGEIVKLDSALDAIVDVGSTIERVPGTFGGIVGSRTEGPVWGRDGSLYFSETAGNVIYKLDANDKASVFKDHSGWDREPSEANRTMGSNGLAVDKQGRVLVCEMGNRRITRIEKDGTVTVIADKFEGTPFNRPNDIAVRSDGSIYFTDTSDTRSEIPHSSVFRIAPDGKVTMLLSDISPNGIAFSPDEKFLYITNSSQKGGLKWMRYPVNSDGTLGAGIVFIDITSQRGVGDGGMDGMKVDSAGNLFATGPGGLWIFSPEGKPLGRIRTPTFPMNVGFGGKDGKTVYLTAWTSVYRIKVKTGAKVDR